jgi:hypothetical protein
MRRDAEVSAAAKRRLKAGIGWLIVGCGLLFQTTTAAEDWPHGRVRHPGIPMPSGCH